ncbi:hypothetical protein Cgig2_007601 [Carnegiea gigantea]|uniref:Uncharacterized protein n=1 Tax=Carnegiea gigantea TaxID=171969 RepID=A0A9Q1GV73_9CARY|nr:hypothetical protein Cgig2_007601 [Carnegiea gigantea]
MLNEKIPSCGLKAYPHIDSNTKWSVDKYNVITEMLRTSDFSWYDIPKMINCERQQHEDFCKMPKDSEECLFATLMNWTRFLDKDEENDDEEEEGESVQLIQPSPNILKKPRKEPTPKGTGKKAPQCEIVDLTLSFNIVSSNLTSFMNDMNSHLSNIASALCSTH